MPMQDLQQKKDKRKYFQDLGTGNIQNLTPEERDESNKLHGTTYTLLNDDAVNRHVDGQRLYQQYLDKKYEANVGDVFGTAADTLKKVGIHALDVGITAGFGGRAVLDYIDKTQGRKEAKTWRDSMGYEDLTSVVGQAAGFIGLPGMMQKVMLANKSYKYTLGVMDKYRKLIPGSPWLQNTTVKGAKHLSQVLPLATVSGAHIAAWNQATNSLDKGWDNSVFLKDFLTMGTQDLVTSFVVPPLFAFRKAFRGQQGAKGEMKSIAGQWWNPESFKLKHGMDNPLISATVAGGGISAMDATLFRDTELVKDQYGETKEVNKSWLKQFFTKSIGYIPTAYAASAFGRSVNVLWRKGSDVWKRFNTQNLSGEELKLIKTSGGREITLHSGRKMPYNYLKEQQKRSGEYMDNMNIDQSMQTKLEDVIPFVENAPPGKANMAGRMEAQVRYAERMDNITDTINKTKPEGETATVLDIINHEDELFNINVRKKDALLNEINHLKYTKEGETPETLRDMYNSIKNNLEKYKATMSDAEIKAAREMFDDAMNALEPKLSLAQSKTSAEKFFKQVHDDVTNSVNKTLDTTSYVGVGGPIKKEVSTVFQSLAQELSVGTPAMYPQGKILSGNKLSEFIANRHPDLSKKDIQSVRVLFERHKNVMNISGNLRELFPFADSGVLIGDINRAADFTSTNVIDLYHNSQRTLQNASDFMPIIKQMRKEGVTDTRIILDEVRHKLNEFQGVSAAEKADISNFFETLFRSKSAHGKAIQGIPLSVQYKDATPQDLLRILDNLEFQKTQMLSEGKYARNKALNALESTIRENLNAKIIQKAGKKRGGQLVQQLRDVNLEIQMGAVNLGAAEKQGLRTMSGQSDNVPFIPYSPRSLLYTVQEVVPTKMDQYTNVHRTMHRDFIRRFKDGIHQRPSFNSNPLDPEPSRIRAGLAAGKQLARAEYIAEEEKKMSGKTWLKWRLGQGADFVGRGADFVGRRSVEFLGMPWNAIKSGRWAGVSYPYREYTDNIEDFRMFVGDKPDEEQ